MERELQVEQAARAESADERRRELPDLRLQPLADRRRREDARRVARVDAGALDVLDDRRDPTVRTVAEHVDVQLERTCEEAVDERGALELELLRAARDAHAPAAEDVRGADEDGVAGLAGEGASLGRGLRIDPGRRAQPELRQQRAEAPAVLGEVDRPERVAEQRHARVGEAGGEAERRLPPERDDDAERTLERDDVEHALERDRLQVEAVARVVVGRDRLRVRVDEHDLVPEPAEGLCGTHAAVVELDPLADPVRARAEHDDRAGRASRRRRPARARGSSRASAPRTRPRKSRRQACRGGRAGRGRPPL